MMPNVAEVLLPAAVATFKQAMPNTRVHIVTGTNSSLLDQIRVGVLDLAVGRLAQPEYMAELSFEPLFEEELSVVVRRHHPSQARRWSIKSVRDYPWIMPPHGSIMRLEIDRFLLSRSIGAHDNVVETMSVTFGRSYVQQTDALWFVPAGAIQTDLQAKKLFRLPLSNGAMVSAVGITTKANAPLSSAAKEMLRALRLSVSTKSMPKHN
jgi:LysR family pca operon transcriptional activator